jgi:hypothetical protein
MMGVHSLLSARRTDPGGSGAGDSARGLGRHVNRKAVRVSIVSQSPSNVSRISRRTLAKGAAWSVPLIVGASQVAHAASSVPVKVQGVICGIDRGPDPSKYNTILMYVYFGWQALPGTTIPQGTSVQYTITIDQTRTSGALPGTPNTSYGTYFTGSLSGPTPTTAILTSPSSYTYTYTLTANQDILVPPSGSICGPYLVWDSDNAVRPSYYDGTAPNVTQTTTFTVTSGGVNGATATSLKWNVGVYNGGVNDNRWRPLSYISSSGYSSLPKVGFHTRRQCGSGELLPD